ncbi:hypothetical protein R3P38DRAFT_3375754 [Favolaschia claudopus]|uniref:Uncharacterized protein n=1 Tax=Favolaschia claudopus TaxID=2862362 RepID=A0AAV9ZHT9_9AGAR
MVISPHRKLLHMRLRTSMHKRKSIGIQVQPVFKLSPKLQVASGKELDEKVWRRRHQSHSQAEIQRVDSRPSLPTFPPTSHPSHPLVELRASPVKTERGQALSATRLSHPTVLHPRLSPGLGPVDFEHLLSYPFASPPSQPPTFSLVCPMRRIGLRNKVGGGVPGVLTHSKYGENTDDPSYSVTVSAASFGEVVLLAFEHPDGLGNAALDVDTSSDKPTVPHAVRKKGNSENLSYGAQIKAEEYYIIPNKRDRPSPQIWLMDVQMVQDQREKFPKNRPETAENSSIT